MESKQVKMVFTEKILKKFAWTIPITYQNNKWYTGQNLQYDNLTNEPILNEEDRKKYPFVINPNTYYKVPHGRVFNLGDIADKALYDLCLITEKISATKKEWHSGRHVGYFEDKEAEATVEVDVANKEFEAMQAVMNLSDPDYEAVVLMLNYTAKKEDFNINVRTSSITEKKAAIFKLIKKDPVVVLNCFEKFNPNVKDDLFIMKLLHNRFILKSGYDYFEANNGIKGTYIGSTLERVKDYLNKKENSHLRDKFARLIEQKETGLVVEVPVDMAEQMLSKENKISMLVAQIKSAMFDGDLSDAGDKLATLLRLTSVGDEVYSKLVSKYNTLVDEASKSSMENLEIEVNKRVVAEMEDIEKDWTALSLEELLLITTKPGIFVTLKDEVKANSESKESLLDYMISKKTSQLHKKYMQNKNK